MKTKLVETLKYAQVPIKLNTNPGDEVLIVADTNTDSVVWQSYAAASHQNGCETIIALITPRKHHQANPPVALGEAMKRSDVVILLTSKAMVHSSMSHEAMSGGTKFIASEEITPDMLSRGAAVEDYKDMENIGKLIVELWNNGKTARVTSEHGTNLNASIEGRKGYYVTGKAVHQEGIDIYCAAFPDGEVGISPIEGSGNGRVVWDTSMHVVGLLSGEYIETEFINGISQGFQGGVKAQQLEEYIKKNGDENSWNLAEISIGLNPYAEITGSMREDKKLLGAVHIAVGLNSDTGGKIDSKLHIDGCIRYPTVYIDDFLVVEKGKIQV